MARNERAETDIEGSGVDPCLARNGGLSYLEIPAVDHRRSAAFYEKVVGWNVQGADTDDPRFSDATGHLIGRWICGRAASRDAGLLPYFYVDPIDDAIKHVEAYGGEISKAIYPEGNLLVALVRDPAGNEIGLWQQGPS
jgi:uncharacterized protein